MKLYLINAKNVVEWICFILNCTTPLLQVAALELSNLKSNVTCQMFAIWPILISPILSFAHRRVKHFYMSVIKKNPIAATKKEVINNGTSAFVSLSTT